MPDDQKASDVPKLPIAIFGLGLTILTAIATFSFSAIKDVYDTIDAKKKEITDKYDPVLVQERVTDEKLQRLQHDVDGFKKSFDDFKSASSRYSGEDAIRDKTLADAIRQDDLARIQSQLEAIQRELAVLQADRKRPQK